LEWVRSGPFTHTNRIEDLDERLDRLVMIMLAMWALMEEQGMTSEKPMAKIEEIDLQDGTADGQLRPRFSTVSTFPLLRDRQLRLVGALARQPCCIT
jgi:hypothetical protein